MDSSVEWLSLIEAYNPTIGTILREYGDTSISRLLDRLSMTGSFGSVQPRQDLFDLIHKEVTEHFNEETANTVILDLQNNPIMPTSNHYGIDTAADSLQGTLLFLMMRHKGNLNKPIVVLGFSSVSMNNSFSYPMGLQFYDHESASTIRLPQRLPIFPNQVKRTPVCQVGPFDKEMVYRARKNLLNKKRMSKITDFSYRALLNTLEEVFLDESILDMPTHLAQACAINNLLWSRSFKEKSTVGPFIQISIEKICGELLCQDLHQSDSLIHSLFFSANVLEALLKTLDGIKSCWHLNHLHLRLNNPRVYNAGGTVFFWGISKNNRRIPLYLMSKQTHYFLVGIGDDGEYFEKAFSASQLIESLKKGELIPSLFTCFVVLAFARGIHCIGGYYQCEYLPLIRDGIIHALMAHGDYQDKIDIIQQLPVSTCLASIQWLALRRKDNSIIPIGPVELAHTEGIQAETLKAIDYISVKDAHLLAFSECLDQLVPMDKLKENWRYQLTKENGLLRHLCTYQGIPVEI